MASYFGVQIFVDTSSILEEQCDLFWTYIVPLLHKHRAKVVIPYSCVQEIEKRQTNRKKTELAKRAIHRR